MGTTPRRARRVKSKAEPSPIVTDLGALAVVILGGLAAICLYTDRAGVIGDRLGQALRLGLGGAAGWWLIGLVVTGIIGIALGTQVINRMRLVGLILAGLCLAGWYHAGFPPETAMEAGTRGYGGGLVGAIIAAGLARGFGAPGRTFVLFAGSVVAVLLVVQVPLRTLSLAGYHLVLALLPRRSRRDEPRPIPVDGEPESTPIPAEPEVTPEPDLSAPEPSEPIEVEAVQPAVPAGTGYEQLSLPASQYELPPLTLLNRPPTRSPRLRRDIQERGRLLEETLASFGVTVRVVGASQGPAVTRFELQPAPGVKVSRIVGLANDLALSLAAPDIRIEAPIPGKAALGVEVPNEQVAIVTLREVLSAPEFAHHPSRLAMGLGRDVAGRPVVAGLDRLLHVLIAGATGSGKSVCLNSLIMSLLCRAVPTDLRLLLIDPKVVELSNYNGIPHLLSPVVTDARQAAGCLKWAVAEMERRYALFAKSGVKDIVRYNDLVPRSGEGDHEYMPYLVIVIDELADLMAVAPTEVEDCIQRLAQMARAAGIHLLVATQRPSVDVITGVIKANIPTRIAFTVASGIDSRTILDTSGAEKLVGRGDMLWLPAGAGKPVRVQGAFISDREIDAVVTFWRAQGKPRYADLTPDARDGGSADEDELVPRAARIVVDYGQASASLLQRRLRVGYARAARIIDQLEERGFVGPHEGSRPREVRLTAEEWTRLFGNATDDPRST